MRGGLFLRAQVSIEYLFIMGIAMLILLPLVVLYFSENARLGDETNSAIATRATTEIVQAADSVYYLGAPSTRTLTVEFPKNVLTAELVGKSVVLMMSSSHGNYEQIGWSAANLTGSINTIHGPHVLKMQALPDGRVNVTEQ